MTYTHRRVTQLDLSTMAERLRVALVRYAYDDRHAPDRERLIVALADLRRVEDAINHPPSPPTYGQESIRCAQ